jgi:hypothetical protein
MRAGVRVPGLVHPFYRGYLPEGHDREWNKRKRPLKRPSHKTASPSRPVRLSVNFRYLQVGPVSRADATMRLSA